MTDNEYRELEQRLHKEAAIHRNHPEGWLSAASCMNDAATAILTLLAERPPREPEGERPRDDAAPGEPIDDAARFRWLCDASGKEWDALFSWQMVGRLREGIAMLRKSESKP